jgi:pimeloyl-ACP methyl ester carboxylesterase
MGGDKTDGSSASRQSELFAALPVTPLPSSGGARPPARDIALNANRKIVKNGALAVEVIVNGQSGPPVVLIPSWGRDSDEFAPLADKIARAGFRVLRPVPRGAGATDGPVEGVTMHDLARDVVAVIEQENSGPAIVAGHAFGAYVARAVATQRPDLVCGLVLLAAGQRAPASKELVDAVLKSGDMSLPDSERLVHLRHVFFAPGNDPSVWLSGWNPRIGIASASAFKTPQSEYWQGGDAPVLDLIACNDPLRPAGTYEDIREDLGSDRVSVVMIPDASHAVVLEQPDLVADAFLKFARAHAPRANPVRT